MVEEVKRRLINNKVFSKDIREELSAYQFTNLSEELMEFAELQKMFKQLMKKRRPGEIIHYVLFHCIIKFNKISFARDVGLKMLVKSINYR